MVCCSRVSTSLYQPSKEKNDEKGPFVPSWYRGLSSTNSRAWMLSLKISFSNVISAVRTSQHSLKNCWCPMKSHQGLGKRSVRISSYLTSATTWSLWSTTLLSLRWVSSIRQIPELLLRSWKCSLGNMEFRRSILTMDCNMLLQSLQSLQVLALSKYY